MKHNFSIIKQSILKFLNNSGLYGQIAITQGYVGRNLIICLSSTMYEFISIFLIKGNIIQPWAIQNIDQGMLVEGKDEYTKSTSSFMLRKSPLNKVNLNQFFCTTSNLERELIGTKPSPFRQSSMY
jgi:hypothetical protein